MKHISNFLSYIRTNNKGGGDIQFASISFIYIFVFCIALVLDFWTVSTAKNTLIKEIQSAQVYAMVQAVANSPTARDPQLVTNASNPYISEQAIAVRNAAPEMNDRLENISLIKDYEIIQLTPYTPLENGIIVGIGLNSVVDYQARTFVKSPQQIMFFTRGNLEQISSAQTKQVTIQTVLRQFVSYD